MNHENSPLINDNRPSSNQVMGYEQMLSLMGVGRYHYGVIFYCALANAADAVEIVAISFVISSAKNDFGMTAFDEGILTAIIFFGMMVGGWIWGSMADQAKYGRKTILFYSLLINAVFGLLSAFAINFSMLLILRFFSGVGVGGSIPVNFSYAAEFFPKEKRGQYLALLAVSWPFGATLTSMLAFAIIPNINTIYIASVSIQSWRLFLIPCCLPAFLASLAFYSDYVDYSPKWLIYSAHNYIKASQILGNIARINNVDYSNSLIQNEQQMFSADTLKSWVQHDEAHNRDDQFSDSSKTCMSKYRKVWLKTKLLFSKEHRRSHVLSSIVWFTLSYGFYGLAEWLPTYFESIQQVNEYKAAILTSVVQFPGAILTVWLLEYVDPKNVLSISIALGTITMISIPYLTNGEQIVATMCIFNGVTVIAWSALNVVATALSPTFIRSTSYGFFAACGRFGSIFGNITFGLFGSNDIAGALSLCGLMLAIGTVSCLLLPSTKGLAIK